jgi:carbonic anhydrase/acetyltransferase-like protein (isoleucine patch superfamily)
MATILPFDGVEPTIHPSAFVAPTAVLVGNVTVGPESSIWFGAVLRGDDPEHGIVVGARSSVQDNCVVHVGAWGPTVIGEDVTVGHGAKFESCTIGDRTVVGMNAVILQNARIGPECLLAANTVVLEGSEIPGRSLVAGVPGRVKKTLEGNAARWIEGGGGHYVELSRSYLDQGVGSVARDDEVGRGGSGVGGRGA